MQMRMGVDMKLRDAIIVFAVALIVMVPAVMAGQKQGDQPDNNKSASPFKLDNTRDRLIHRIDLWHDAILKGKQSEGEKHYENIVLAVEEDIVVSRRLLKLFAQQILLQNAANETEEPNLVDRDSRQTDMEVDRRAIEDLAAVINTKVALKEALDRATAFSNRYRLLGDYINLLRKELDIPKVKLAYESMQSSQASTD